MFISVEENDLVVNGVGYHANMTKPGGFYYVSKQYAPGGRCMYLCRDPEGLQWQPSLCPDGKDYTGHYPSRDAAEAALREYNSIPRPY